MEQIAAHFFLDSSVPEWILMCFLHMFAILQSVLFEPESPYPDGKSLNPFTATIILAVAFLYVWKTSLLGPLDALP